MTLRGFDGTQWVAVVPDRTLGVPVVGQPLPPEDTSVLWEDDPATMPTPPQVVDLHRRHALVNLARGALRANRDFIALPSPTNAQSIAQVKALSRQNNSIIRLVLGLLDDID